MPASRETAPAARIYTPEYYERLHAIEDRHPWARAMRKLALDALQKRFPDKPIERILDAGCGTGLFLQECAARRGTPFAAGADVAWEGLRFARARGAERVVCAAVEALPFSSAVFDLAACNDVVQHLSNEQAERAWRELARVLRPGGVLMVRTAARRGLGAKKHLDSEDYQQWEPGKMQRALEAAGFEATWLTRVNWLPSLLADLRALRRPRPQGDVGLSLAADEGEGWKNRALAAYWALEGWVVSRGWRPPGGHTLLCLAVRKA